jgi:hypothetical protein
VDAPQAVAVSIVADPDELLSVTALCDGTGMAAAAGGFLEEGKAAEGDHPREDHDPTG